MDMPKPGAAHTKLEALAGQWTGEEVIMPSPMDPTGGPANAKIDNRFVLGGFVLVQDYVQERSGQVNFEGHAVIGYDAGTDTYVMDWWDTFGMGRSEYRGKWSGSTLTLESATPMGRSRATYDLSQPDAYEFSMEVSLDGNNWATFMKGSYRRLA
jgi:hypothetical protein